jgi:hypothetical protein
LQDIDEQVSILKQLRLSKLGTGEAVYVESIANKAHMAFETAKQHLEALGFNIKNHGRWPAISTPDSAVLDEKLSALGVETTLLKPMSARFNGYYHKIDAILSFELCAAGQFRFTVRWTSAHHPPTVCCHDLNNSARAHVCSLLWLLISMLILFSGQQTVRHISASHRCRAVARSC